MEDQKYNCWLVVATTELHRVDIYISACRIGIHIIWDLVNMQVLNQHAWGGAQASSFLTSFQMMLTKLVNIRLH